MNKLTKGSLATGAGLVLLLGGTGTFMTWQNAEEFGGDNNVVAGHLTVGAETNGRWASNLGTVTDIANHQVVPGEILTYTADVPVTALGDNLQVTAGITETSISPLVAGDAEDVALDGVLTADAKLDVSGSIFTEIVDGAGAGTGVYDVAESESGTATVSVDITFPKGVEGDNATQGGQVDLTTMTFTLTQYLPAV